jgi:hypothetical protein
MVHTHTHIHTPKTVRGFHDVRVLWNKGIQTDTEVMANNESRGKTFILTDVAIPADRNFKHEEARNKLNTAVCVQKVNGYGT